MDFSEYEFKFGKTILKEHWPAHLRDIEDVLRGFQHPLGRRVRPTPAETLQGLFEARGWEREHPVVTPEGGIRSGLKFDLYKEPVAIEVQLTDPSDCYNDYLKFLLAYNLGVVEVGVEIVYDDSLHGRVFSNTPRLARVRHDLWVYRRVLSCPLWVIGLKG